MIQRRRKGDVAPEAHALNVVSRCFVAEAIINDAGTRDARAKWLGDSIFLVRELWFVETKMLSD